jgi:hypothetical protein
VADGVRVFDMHSSSGSLCRVDVGCAVDVSKLHAVRARDQLTLRPTASLSVRLAVESVSTCCLRLHGSGIESDKFLLALASTVILDSGSRGTHDHIFLSHDFLESCTSSLSEWGV